MVANERTSSVAVARSGQRSRLLASTPSRLSGCQQIQPATCRTDGDLARATKPALVLFHERSDNEPLPVALGYDLTVHGDRVEVALTDTTEQMALNGSSWLGRISARRSFPARRRGLSTEPCQRHAAAGWSSHGEPIKRRHECPVDQCRISPLSKSILARDAHIHMPPMLRNVTHDAAEPQRPGAGQFKVESSARNAGLRTPTSTTSNTTSMTLAHPPPFDHNPVEVGCRVPNDMPPQRPCDRRPPES